MSPTTIRISVMRRTSIVRTAIYSLVGVVSCSTANTLPPTGETAATSESGSDTGSETDSTSETGTDSTAATLLLRGGTVVDRGLVDVAIVGGVITAVGPNLPQPTGAEVVDVSGYYLAPAFIDSHVHLAYYPAAGQLARRGVAAAVDLAAPLSFLSADVSPLTLLQSGPMVTAIGGYPTQSWGADGYGIECADAAAVETAINDLANLGVALIKVPVTRSSGLDDSSLAAAANAAHGAGLKVVTHALTSDDVQQAGKAGFDVLAHTPTQPFDPELLDLWKDRAVVSTLIAFGGSAATLQNLKDLSDAGATILYGTDLGNTSDPGIQAAELEAMAEAGLTPEQILASGTSTPAAFWGLSELGAIAPGKAASILVLHADPMVDPLTLADPESVYLAGILQK